jgi:seryl-tRNA synthetase
MGKNEKTPVTIDGVEHQFEDLTREQQVLLNHVADLDRKLDSARFNVDQLQVGRNAFFELLKQALEAKPEEAQAVVTDVEPK